MATLKKATVSPSGLTPGSASRRAAGRHALQPNARAYPAAEIFRVQQPLGNQAVQRLLRSGAIQAKLRVSQPDDPSEREADRVADQVMRMRNPRTTEGAVVSQTTQGDHIERLCAVCEEEEETELHAKAAPGQAPDAGPHAQTQVNALGGGGQPLPESVRAFFEPRFGHDFSQVRIHADTRAAESARAVKALAYTRGRHIVFGTGHYAPGTTGGRWLLAHELTHVVQQGHQPASLGVQRQAAGGWTPENISIWLRSRLTPDCHGRATPTTVERFSACGSPLKPFCVPTARFDISFFIDALGEPHPDPGASRTVTGIFTLVTPGKTLKLLAETDKEPGYWGTGLALTTKPGLRSLRVSAPEGATLNVFLALNDPRGRAIYADTIRIEPEPCA